MIILISLVGGEVRGGVVADNSGSGGNGSSFSRRLNGIEDLIAIEEIRQLVHRYAMAVDGKDFDGIVSLFAEDVHAGAAGQGRQALKSVYQGLLADAELSILSIANLVVDFQGPSRATGAVYCRCETSIGGEWIIQQILYRDAYERHDGTWYFRRREHLLFYGAPLGVSPLGLAPCSGHEYGLGRGTAP